MAQSDYVPAIGLEVHIQLNTQSKIFSSDSTEFGREPNLNISVVSMGYPGTLPVLNFEVIEKAVLLGLACNCEISSEVRFDRKNYFYPDLPKGYQITQERNPICKKGYLTIQTENGSKRVDLRKIHLEEDAGKLIHNNEEFSLVDFNRAGVPLLEMVTEPTLSSGQEAHTFLTQIRRLVRCLNISDGHMEQGSLRCDANISIRNKKDKTLGIKVEIKNLNSFKFLRNAIDNEILRQVEFLETGKKINSTTRMFDQQKGKTFPMREKETLNDYRYFPEPDLSPVILEQEWINNLKVKLPEMPWDTETRLKKKYGLPQNEIKALLDDPLLLSYMQKLEEQNIQKADISRWVFGPIKTVLKKSTDPLAVFQLPMEKLKELIDFVNSGEVSFSKSASPLLEELVLNSNADIDEIASQLDLTSKYNQDDLKNMIVKILNEYPEKVEAYKNGKTGLKGFFIGKLMKLKGGVDPKLANQLLDEMLLH